ncbi:MAG: hypothetical protein WC300_06435, partial [Candidatus Omnitrophota bacterium]
SDTTSQPAAPAGAQTATSPATEASIKEIESRFLTGLGLTTGEHLIDIARRIKETSGQAYLQGMTNDYYSMRQKHIENMESWVKRLQETQQTLSAEIGQYTLAIQYKTALDEANELSIERDALQKEAERIINYMRTKHGAALVKAVYRVDIETKNRNIERLEKNRELLQKQVQQYKAGAKRTQINNYISTIDSEIKRLQQEISDIKSKMNRDPTVLGLNANEIAQTAADWRFGNAKDIIPKQLDRLNSMISQAESKLPKNFLTLDLVKLQAELDWRYGALSDSKTALPGIIKEIEQDLTFFKSKDSELNFVSDPDEAFAIYRNVLSRIQRFWYSVPAGNGSGDGKTWQEASAERERYAQFLESGFARIGDTYINDKKELDSYQLRSAIYVDKANNNAAVMVTYARVGDKWEIVTYGPASFNDATGYMYDFNWADKIEKVSLDPDTGGFTAELKNAVTGDISQANFSRDGWLIERRHGIDENNASTGQTNMLWLPSEGFTPVGTTYDVNIGVADKTHRLNMDGSRGKLLYQYSEYKFNNTGKVISYKKTEYDLNGDIVSITECIEPVAFITPAAIGQAPKAQVSTIAPGQSRDVSGFHVVQPWQTIFSIAANYYGDAGRYKELVNLNKELLGGSLSVKPGMVLSVPVRIPVVKSQPSSDEKAITQDVLGLDKPFLIPADYGRVRFEHNIINDEFTLITYKESGERDVTVTFSNPQQYNVDKLNEYIRISKEFQKNQSPENIIAALEQDISAIPVNVGYYFMGYMPAAEQAGIRYGLFENYQQTDENALLPITEVQVVKNYRLDKGWVNYEFFDIRNDGVSQGKASNDQNGEISFNVYDEAGKQVGQNTYVFGFNAQTGQIATG